MVITIDGPAGVGKSSVASYLAKQQGILLLKSGCFYRAVTLALQAELEALPPGAFEPNAGPPKDKPDKPETWGEFQRKMEALQIEQQGKKIFLNGMDVGDRLQTAELDRLTPRLSGLPPVRHFVNRLLRSQAQGRSLIAEGRDMGTVVFAQAEHKFFLDASAGIRAQRRWAQFGAAEKAKTSLKGLERQLVERDEIDRNKPGGALKAAKDAHILDTGSLTFEAVCQIISGLIRSR